MRQRELAVVQHRDQLGAGLLDGGPVQSVDQQRRRLHDRHVPRGARFTPRVRDLVTWTVAPAESGILLFSDLRWRWHPPSPRHLCSRRGSVRDRATNRGHPMDVKSGKGIRDSRPGTALDLEDIQAATLRGRPWPYAGVATDQLVASARRPAQGDLPGRRPPPARRALRRRHRRRGGRARPPRAAPRHERGPSPCGMTAPLRSSGRSWTPLRSPGPPARPGRRPE